MFASDRKILSWLACVRWIAIWTFPDPQTAFINVVSGLLYLPLLLGCLMLLGGSQAGINGLIGCFRWHHFCWASRRSFVRRLFQIGVSGPVLQVHMLFTGSWCCLFCV